jgi:hypothetical protein
LGKGKNPQPIKLDSAGFTASAARAISPETAQAIVRYAARPAESKREDTDDRRNP